jgi:Derlin-2/3
MGLISIPYAYWPYLMIAMDFVMGGPSAAASAVRSSESAIVKYYG